MDNSSPELRDAHQVAMNGAFELLKSKGMSTTDGAGGFLMAMACMKDGQYAGHDFRPLLKSFEQGELAKANAIAKGFRSNTRAKTFPRWAEGMADSRKAEIAKALDVGSLTNVASFTGGQSLGLISYDTKMARGTVRPRSFTLYNCLNKTTAGQIVDYWAYASGTGGSLPGSAYGSFANQTNTLVPNAGSYQTKFLNLKLLVDPRAITMALAQQNSFVNIGEQENANASLNIMSSIEWSIYWGNPALYPNQPAGIASLVPAQNIKNFWTYYNSPAVQSQGISQQQALFNLIYETAGSISGFRTNGQVTHAFQSVAAAADLQSLVTSQLRNIANTISDKQATDRSIVVNGDLVGMRTRFGDVQFPIDIFLTARDTPAAGIFEEATGLPQNLAPAVLSAPAVTSATLTAAAVASGAVGSGFTAAFGASGNVYTYAVAAADVSMNESALTFVGPVSGVAAGGGVALTITPGANGTAVAFRCFRSGIGYNAIDPTKVRFIGDIAANGVSPVVFTDLNQHIPGSDTVFMLDLDDEDDALDYRVMLPLTKIELYAQALFMPWAVAHIGAPRLRIPKWHGMVKNYPALSPDFNALVANT